MTATHYFTFGHCFRHTCITSRVRVSPIPVSTKRCLPPRPSHHLPHRVVGSLTQDVPHGTRSPEKIRILGSFSHDNVILPLLFSRFSEPKIGRGNNHFASRVEHVPRALGTVSGCGRGQWFDTPHPPQLCSTVGIAILRRLLCVCIVCIYV